MTYKDFLAGKAIVSRTAGREVDEAILNPNLFPFQRKLVWWALRKGRCALFCDTGLGKTIQQLAWAEHAAERTLILAPLAVAHQTVREGSRFGIPVTYARCQDDAAPTGITITNYEMLSRFDTSQFGAVVLDECFAADTLVDTPAGPREIRDIRTGDEIINAYGVDRVADVHRREVAYGVRVRIAGNGIICSPNHPFFTQRGWVGAQDLEPGDWALASAAAVRMVRYGIQANEVAGRKAEVLRSILLSEMADEPAAAPCEGACAGGGREARQEAVGVASFGGSSRDGGNGSHPGAQPDVQPRDSGEDLPPVESHEARTFRAWGQRAWIDGASDDLDGCSRADLAGGVCFVTGQTDSRLSDALQARLGASRAASSYRGGWQLPSQPEGPGCEENGEAGFARVDGIEVLEPGHPDLEQYRSADGRVYFYDLGATRHPSFSVNGLLVHNSSILKNFDGKTRQALCDAFADTPMRLACTATPAPNDIVEIGNHSEFLGVMPHVEMRAAFFTHEHDKATSYKLKTHARDAFYRWMASWGMSIRKPSDLGFDDTGYDLPGLSIVSSIVETDHRPEGMLFATSLNGIGERAKVRRATLDARVARAVSLVESEPDEPWIVWCGLNDEAAAVAAAIPGAINVEGSMSPDAKAEALAAFSEGRARVIVTKPSIAGMGLNWQHCARQVFVGLSDSYEDYYQCIRRSYRFGQVREVVAHIVLSDLERAIYENVMRKERDADRTAAELVKHLAEFGKAEILGAGKASLIYEPKREAVIPSWLTKGAS